MQTRLIHDCAVVMAQHIVELMGDLVPPEARKDAYDEAYCVCKAGLECYEIQLDRMQQRLRPLQN